MGNGAYVLVQKKKGACYGQYVTLGGHSANIVKYQNSSINGEVCLVIYGPTVLHTTYTIYLQKNDLHNLFWLFAKL